MALVGCAKLFRICNRVKLNSDQIFGTETHLFASVQDQMYLKFEHLGGLDALESLQMSESHDVYERAMKILLNNY